MQTLLNTNFLRLLFEPKIKNEELTIEDIKLLDEYFQHQYIKPEYIQVIRKISRIAESTNR
jgi:hypothetical protein